MSTEAPKSNWQAPQQVPVHVVTGFLGAGKTSLINRYMGTPFISEAALIINEFGDVGIDHLLVEQSSDGVIELSDGCLCCTVRGELVDTLADLMDRVQTGRVRPFARVLVETTGLADPGPVIQAIIGHQVLAQSYQFAGLVTVMDAVNGLPTLENHIEARQQVRLADRLVITKSGLAGARTAARLREELILLNPRAEVIDGDDGSLAADAVFECGTLNLADEPKALDAWLGSGNGHDHDHDHDHDGSCDHSHEGHHHHSDGIVSESLTIDEAITPQAMMMFLDLLRSAHGPKLLRMKGIIKLTDNPDRPIVVHAVQSVIAEPVRLKSWPEGSDRNSRLVVITRDMPAGFVGELFSAFSDQPAVGRPDSQALMGNPLSVPGGYTPGRG